MYLKKLKNTYTKGSLRVSYTYNRLFTESTAQRFQLLERQKYYNDMDLYELIMKHNFPRFFPWATGWRKARESLIYQKIVQIRVIPCYFLYLKRINVPCSKVLLRKVKKKFL